MKRLSAADPRQLGPYRVLAEIGPGRIGRVLLGVAPNGQFVAIKEIHPQLAANEAFRQAVTAARAMTGPGVAAVVDADAETRWLASVFVPGPALAEAVEAAGPLPPEAVLRLAAGLASTLAAVPVTLTPGNVLLAANGPWVTDVGISQPQASSSDVFSLGCVLVLAATGVNDVAHADLTTIPEPLRGIIQSCLATDPAERPTASQLLDQIQVPTVDSPPWPPVVHDMIAARQMEAAWYFESGDQRAGESPPPRSGRRRGLVAAAIVAVLALGGLVGWLLWPESEPDLVPGTIQAALLTPQEVSALVGSTVVINTASSEPPPELDVTPSSCSVAVGPATQAVYARGWTVFGSVTYQDPEAASHTVIQVVGSYPDGDKAREVFRTLTDGVNQCTSAVRNDADSNTSKWSYTAEAPAADRVSWTATEDGGDGWACYRQARLKGSAVVQVAVCQAGDGKPAAAKIIDQLAGRVIE